MDAVSRRTLLATGAVTLLATQAQADDKGPSRNFEGESKKGDLQEALEAATKSLSDALPEGGVRDAQATWSLSHVTGVTGGFTGSRSVKVIIAAHRSPAWKKA